MASNPTVLYHIPDPEKARLLTDFCRSIHFQTKPISGRDAGRTIGSLCGQPGAQQTAGKVPAGYKLPELLIFSDLSETALDFFLKAYRQAGIAPVALKAIVTPHNVLWPLYALTEELEQERAAMLLQRSQTP